MEPECLQLRQCWFAAFSVEGVALHELGHALGLGHESGVLATMNAIRRVGPWAAPARMGSARRRPRGRPHPLSRRHHGERCRRVGVRGTGQLVASTLSVARGGSATLEFTFSNLSTATKSFDINFYLSTNTIIRTIDDTLLGSNTGAWEAPDSRHFRSLPYNPIVGCARNVSLGVRNRPR